MGMAANIGLPSWLIDRLEIGGFLENTNRRPQKTVACVNRLSGKKIVRKGKGTGRGGGELRGEQAFSLFPLPSTPLEQRPVHRTHTSKFISGVPTLPFRRFFELFYSK